MGQRRERLARPRYRRIGTAAASFSVTLVAVMGGLGALPGNAGEASPAAGLAPPETRAAAAGSAESGAVLAEDSRLPRPGTALELDGTQLPADSGQGRRVVYSEEAQRAWLVEEDGKIARSYLVSGSVYDNLEPGSYEVFSRSEQAYGIDDSGTMKYFVRFAHGENAAIGFHDIPLDDGKRLQRFDQLGTPQSHGCIRQRRADAIALWEFAPLGTTVVVTA